MNIKAIKANYLNANHERDIQFLLDYYARDDMGGGKPLDDSIKNEVVNELSKLRHAFSVLVYVDSEVVGLANCFELFSTFMCKPLINIHDLVVVDSHRGKGISQVILQKVEEIAKSKGCCKVTLEVLSNNKVAMSAYTKFGFSDYRINSDTGGAQYWQKII
jgi:GNAT superfamily N-acetyltransferase